jgi:hypothetical protein
MIQPWQDDKAVSTLRSWLLAALLLGLLASTLAFVAFGPVQPTTVLFGVGGLIALIIGFASFNKAVQNPLIPFFALLCMNILVYIIPKADFMAAGFGLITSIVYIARNFNTVVKNPMSLSFFIFFLINLFYWFFYSTDFVVGKIILANGNFFNKESNNELAKSIVLYASLCPLIACCTVMNAFNAKKEALLSLLKKYYPYCAILFSGLTLIFSVVNVKLDIAGQTLILPLVFIFNIYYWLTIKDEHTPVNESVYWLSQVALLFGIFLKANKTTLLGVILILSLYLLGLKVVYKSLGIQQRLRQFFANPTLVVILILGLLIVGALGVAMGVTELITSKVDYFVNGLSKGSTLDVRTSNWSYFFANWQDKLDITNIVFGFGEAVSRKTIFYISATRHSFPHNNFLVQTLHNAYLEYAFDFGLMAIFYYLPTWLLLKKHIPQFFMQTLPWLRVSSLSVVLTIIFISFYATMDGIRIQVAIFYYLLLFFYDKMYDYLLNSRSSTTTS